MNSTVHIVQQVVLRSLLSLPNQRLSFFLRLSDSFLPFFQALLPVRFRLFPQLFFNLFYQFPLNHWNLSVLTEAIGASRLKVKE